MATTRLAAYRHVSAGMALLVYAESPVRRNHRCALDSKRHSEHGPCHILCDTCSVDLVNVVNVGCPLPNKNNPLRFFGQ